MTATPDGTYRHDVPHLTVGELREALNVLPADMEIRISTVEAPTTRVPRVPGNHDLVLAGTRIYDGDDVLTDYLILEADFSSGPYML